MSDDLKQLEDWVAPLIEKLSQTERRQLAKEIARDLRKSQRERIKAQENPDGSKFEPRKEISGRSGRIRRKAMFSKLRTAKYLKIKTTANAAEIGFAGRVARIANIHQRGLRAKVEPSGAKHDYAKRELLGLTKQEREKIRDSLIEHLTPR